MAIRRTPLVSKTKTRHETDFRRLPFTSHAHATFQNKDVANLSIAYMYTDVYFAITARAMEDAFAMGLTIITVSGNEGNVPYILGYIGGTPNAITVGSTGTLMG